MKGSGPAPDGSSLGRRSVRDCRLDCSPTMKPRRDYTEGLGEDAVVGEAVEAGLDEVERRCRLPRPGRPREDGGALVAHHGGGVEQDVAAAQDRLGVAIVDEVDTLVQVREDVAG